MNRLRHAYHETVPGLEPYFITGPPRRRRSASSPATAPTCRCRTLALDRPRLHDRRRHAGGDQRRAQRRRRGDRGDPGHRRRRRRRSPIGVVAFVLVLADERGMEHARDRVDGGRPPAPVPQPGRLTDPSTGRESKRPRRCRGRWSGAEARRTYLARCRCMAALRDRLTRPWRSISMTTTMTSSPTDTTSSTLGTW